MEIFSVTKFLTEICQKIVTKIVLVTKSSRIFVTILSQFCDGLLTVRITVTNLSQNYDGFVTVICQNFVTKIIFITKFASWKGISVTKL